MTERGKLIIYLGGKGIGKTTYVKQLLKGKKWKMLLSGKLDKKELLLSI
ncbi:MAG: hypothetical protein RXR07_08245 [Sulfolobaceae archaeon]